MTDRTFQQHAQAYGSIPAQIECAIDGIVVYNGSVQTLDQPFPYLPNSELQISNVAWSWQGNADFSGTQQLSITVISGSTLLLANTLANNPAGNLEIFMPFYSVEQSGVVYTDPLTDETLDGISLTGPYDPAIPGQWWWQIPAGSTFTATMHVDAPPPPPEETAP